MKKTTIKTIEEFIALPDSDLTALAYLDEPHTYQNNGKAYLSKGLESIKDSITMIYFKNGSLYIETTLRHNSTSTSSRISLTSSTGAKCHHLTLICD